MSKADVKSPQENQRINKNPSQSKNDPKKNPNSPSAKRDERPGNSQNQIDKKKAS